MLATLIFFLGIVALVLALLRRPAPERIIIIPAYPPPPAPRPRRWPVLLAGLIFALLVGAVLAISQYTITPVRSAPPALRGVAEPVAAPDFVRP